jgi:Fic/DOC family N-terminal
MIHPTRATFNSSSDYKTITLRVSQSRIGTLRRHSPPCAKPGVLLSPLTTQEAVLSSRIEGTFFDHQPPLLSYSLAQSPQGSHGVGDCGRNRNPEHHADPRLPSLRMVNCMTIARPTMHAAARIAAFNRSTRCSKRFMSGSTSSTRVQARRLPRSISPSTVDSSRQFDTELCNVCRRIAQTTEQLRTGKYLVD